ncbi:MAG: pyridoxamine 5'-phosphate oxidase, partial [Flavobacteriales bacterium]
DWYLAAKDEPNIREANAMSLSTFGLDGFPKTRVVLLKRYSWEGFTFFSHYNSEKGLALEAHPKACLSFFWPALEQQIIIKGEVEKGSENLSDGYFESRPRGSQLGAWASEQSQIVESKAVLEERLKALEAQFEGQDIPRPKHWGGYILKPQEMEFWQGRPNRMHDRIRYQLQHPSLHWIKTRLNP